MEMPHEEFLVQEAVSALSNLSFKASFGSIKTSKIIDAFLPLIAFDTDGEAFLINSIEETGDFSVTYPNDKNKVEIVSKSEFDKKYSGYAILAKKLNKRETEERAGHWFFSAFKKSKWLYVQVMVAAMVSNFLSLTVSLFTMTVYDRIIPNGAFDLNSIEHWRYYSSCF